jgi:hypothetical protein
VKNKLNKHIIVVVRRENRQEVLEYSPYRGELQEILAITGILPLCPWVWIQSEKIKPELKRISAKE